MARKPLRSQLNQIRGWVRQGRTDAWIAHQLDVPTTELREFRRRHELSADGDESGEDLRDEIEAEIEAAAIEEAEAAAEAGDEDDTDSGSDPDDDSADDTEDGEGEDEEGEPPARRRRRRRGGRGGAKRPAAALQASFDHGETDGYGLWFDPAVKEDPVYSEHWSGHRQVEVTIEPDRIVIKRTS